MLKNYSGTEPNIHENRSTECVVVTEAAGVDMLGAGWGKLEKRG